MINLKDPVLVIMETELLTVSPDQNLLDVANIFDLKAIHHVPVVKNDELVGMVSKSDFLFFRHEHTENHTREQEMERLREQKIDGVMHRMLLTLSPIDPIEKAIEIFKKNYFHALPVVEGKSLKGLVTPLDVINYLIKFCKQ